MFIGRLKAILGLSHSERRLLHEPSYRQRAAALSAASWPNPATVPFDRAAFGGFDFHVDDPDDASRLPVWVASLIVVMSCSIFWVGVGTIVRWALV